MRPWSSGEDEILINFVRLHEALYNIKSKYYRKAHMKQKLWCEISAVLGKTDAECSKRWCYVRDYYIRRKGKPGSSGETAKKRSDLLSFLDNLHSSKNANNVAEHSFSNSFIVVPQKDENTGDESVLIENTEHNEETDEMDEYNEYTNHDSSHSDDTNMTSRENKSDRKRKYIPQFQECPNPHKICPQNELDETDLFFSSMSKIVKKLPRHEQAHLRMQIGLLVGNAELGNISNDMRPTTST